MKKNWRRLSGVLVGIMSISLLVGCGSSGTDKSYSEESTSNAVEEIVEMDEAGGESSDIPVINTEIGYNRKIIKNGSIHIQTEHFNESVAKLTEYVQSLEGYVESSSIEGNDFYEEYASRSASLTVRIPQKSFDTFMNKGGDFGNVSYLNSDSEDITSQYVDTETRLEALNIRKEHLLALLEQSGELKDLFEIEQELAEVIYEIESYKGTLQRYDSLVDMATIQVEIQEVGKIEVNRPVKTFWDEIKVTFCESIEGVVSVLKGIVLFVIAIVPFLVILVPLIIIIRVVGSKRRLKRMAMHVSFTENSDVHPEKDIVINEYDKNK